MVSLLPIRSAPKVAAPFFLSTAALNSVCARRSNGEAEELSVSIVSVSNRAGPYNPVL